MAPGPWSQLDCLTRTAEKKCHVCPRQEAGWGHCTHVKLHAYETLEQSFKKAKFRVVVSKQELGFPAVRGLLDPSPHPWEECCSFRFASSGS